MRGRLLEAGTNKVMVHDRPATLGFRLPAEWEPHEATWLAWPVNRGDWPGKLAPVPWVYGELVRKLVCGEIVRILAASPDVERRARRLLTRVGVDGKGVEFHHVPTNRSWTRDFGPLFLKRTEPSPEVAIARFRFNGWARYPDWHDDDAVPEAVARRLGYRLVPVTVPGTADRGVVLEGGSIDVNGCGTVLTTEECLLSQDRQVRNPGMSRSELETVMRDVLGVTNIVWLGRGIAGDDTHGHVDDFCRFVNPRTVVLCQTEDPRDPDYRALQENRERLEGTNLEDGSKPDFVPLPMPRPLFFDGHRLPASYANFYIANTHVLVPTFNDPNDRVALGLLNEVFPTREVVGIHAVDLVWGFGTVHCLTQQQPAL